MKKILFILLFAFTLQVSAQDQTNWITDYKVALKQSEAQNKPILAFVTDNQKSEALTTLNDYFFNTDSFKNKFASKVILLKLDVSDKQSYNSRMGIHYTKQKAAPGVALVDKYNATVGAALVNMTPENITVFMTLLNDKL